MCSKRSAESVGLGSLSSGKYAGMCGYYSALGVRQQTGRTPRGKLAGGHGLFPSRQPTATVAAAFLRWSHPEPLANNIEHDERGVGYVRRAADPGLHVGLRFDHDLHRSGLPRVVVPAGHLLG